MADLFCCTSTFSPSFSGTITITLLLSWAPELSGHDKVARTSREVKLCFRQTSSTFTRPRLSRPTIQNASPQRQLLDFACSEQVATSYSHHLLPLNANPLLCFWWNAPFHETEFSWSLRKWPSKSTQNFTNHWQNTGHLILQKLHVISHLHHQQNHQDCQIVHDGGCSHCQRCKAQPSAFTQWGQINHCYIARPALLDYVVGLYCRIIV